MTKLLKLDKHNWMSITLAAAAVSVPLIVGGFATGQERANPSRESGEAIAQRLCSGCHLMSGKPESVVPAGVISLQGIADKPGQTGERIRDVLLMPHAPMPDIRLSISEIHSIVMYLESLRTNPATPPLFKPGDGDVRPKYPRAT